ncbi:hypothetical protein ACFXJ8_07980 [Nonomuraea sp. NPDC059194]
MSLTHQLFEALKRNELPPLDYLKEPVAQLAYLVERFHEFDGWPGREL